MAERGPWSGRGSGAESAAIEYRPASSSSAGRSAIEAVVDRNADTLMSIDGVEGVGIGRDRVGNDAIVVYLRDASARTSVPAEVEGVRVETTVTGIVDPY